MLTKESERTRVMKENFMAQHLEGDTIPEIAERYNLSRATVYRHLQEIADNHGVTRESLLKIIRVPTTERQYAEEERRTKVTADELKAGFKSANDSINNLINYIDLILMEEI